MAAARGQWPAVRSRDDRRREIHRRGVLDLPLDDWHFLRMSTSALLHWASLRQRLIRSTLATVAIAAMASAARGQGRAFREIATLGRYESEGWITATADGRSVLAAVDSALVLVDVKSGRSREIARG